MILSLKVKQRTVTQLEIDELKKENAELRALVAKQAKQIELLQEQVNYLMSKLYGKSSEQTPEDGQTSLFEDDENGVFEQPESTGEQIETIIVRQKKRSNSKTKITKELPIKDEVIRLTDHNCDQCGTQYQIFKKKAGRKLHFKPAELYIVQQYKEIGKCQHCSESIDHFGDKLTSAQMPAVLIPNSLASADLVAAIIDNKYKLALPLDRQRRSFKELGLAISEVTLCNWVITAAKRLTPLYQLLTKRLKGQTHLHGDETPIQVLRERGKTPTSKSYLWELRSAELVNQPIVLFHYAPSRSEKVACYLYRGFHGTLVCDGYAGYNHLPVEVIRAGCWAHSRRKFIEAANGITGQTSISRQFVTLINQLFRIEKRVQGASNQERLAIRQEQSRAIVNQIFTLAEKTRAIEKSKLGRAIQYLINQRSNLLVFLSDPQVALSNNVAERSIKTSVIGRKNWLFSTSQRGANANALFLSFFETAKANGINLRKYLIYLFKQLPKLGAFPKECQLEAYLPWTKYVQQSCTD